MRAVVFDLGGVVVSSPILFIAQFEADRGLPRGLFARIIMRDPQGPFQQLEEGKMDRDEFCRAMAALFRAEGHTVDVHAWLKQMEQSMEVRDYYIAAMRAIKAKGLLLGVITNNWPLAFGKIDMEWLRGHADVVVESHLERVRKPARRIYETCHQRLAVLDATLQPQQIVFLDDIAGNLKVPRQLGWRTIHVRGDGKEALAELFALLGIARL